MPRIPDVRVITAFIAASALGCLLAGCGGATGPTGAPGPEANDALLRIFNASRETGPIDIYINGTLFQGGVAFAASAPAAAAPAHVAANGVVTIQARRSSDGAILAAETVNLAADLNVALVFTGALAAGATLPDFHVLSTSRTDLADGNARLITIQASPKADNFVDMFYTLTGNPYPAAPWLGDFPRNTPSSPQPLPPGSYKLRATKVGGVGTFAELTLNLQAGRVTVAVVTDTDAGTGSFLRSFTFQNSPLD